MASYQLQLRPVTVTRCFCGVFVLCEYRKSELTWDDVSRQFEQSVLHFDTLDSPTVAMMRDSEDAHLRRYAQIFDQSRSQQPAVIISH